MLRKVSGLKTTVQLFSYIALTVRVVIYSSCSLQASLKARL